MLQTNSKATLDHLRWALERRFPLISPTSERETQTPGGIPAGLFYRFLGQNLLQREERAIDSARVLGAILARPDGKQLASELDPEYRPHRRLVCEDLLAEVRHEVGMAIALSTGAALSHEQRERLERALDQHYRGVMTPYIVALQERKTGPGAKRGASLPKGFLSGRQGTINSLALLDHILNDEAGLSLKQQLRAIGGGDFSVEFFSKHHFGGALTTKFNNSPSDALRAHFREHPSPRVRRSASHLGQEHFPQVNSLWCESGSPEFAPGDGWEYDSLGSCWLNKGLARVAIGQVIDDYIGNPTGRPLPSLEYITRIEDFIATATEDGFNAHRVRFNRTFGTVIPAVYQGSLAEGVIDYLRHSTRHDIRDHFARLRPYHFRRINSWTNSKGEPAYAVGREAIHEAFSTLEKHLGPERFDIYRIPELFETQWMSKDIFFCRFTPADVVTGVFGFPMVSGVVHFLKHHPDGTIARFYRDLEPRHFARVTNGLWSMQDFGEKGPLPGWSYDPSRGRYVNVTEGRRMTAELIEKVIDGACGEAIRLIDIPTAVTLGHFNTVPLAFNSYARPMLAAVYGDSPRRALLDCITSAEFTEVIAKRPEAAEGLRSEKELADFRTTSERLLTLPLRQRFLPDA